VVEFIMFSLLGDIIKSFLPDSNGSMDFRLIAEVIYAAFLQILSSLVYVNC
jgi:hypothetical protein